MTQWVKYTVGTIINAEHQSLSVIGMCVRGRQPTQTPAIRRWPVSLAKSMNYSFSERLCFRTQGGE